MRPEVVLLPSLEVFRLEAVRLVARAEGASAVQEAKERLLHIYNDPAASREEKKKAVANLRRAFNLAREAEESKQERLDATRVKKQRAKATRKEEQGVEANRKEEQRVKATRGEELRERGPSVKDFLMCEE